MVTVKRRAANAAFRAIADPTRREILNLLRVSPQTVGELAGNFRTSRPAISRHLRILRSAGLVAAQTRGATHICRLNAKPLQAVSAWLQDYQVFWSESLGALKQHVEGSANRKEEKR